MRKVSSIYGYFFNIQAAVRANAAGDLCKCSLLGYFFNPVQINKINHLMHAAIQSPLPLGDGLRYY